jgi:hypothetical protein
MSGLQGRHEMPDQHHAARLQPRIHFGAHETTLGFLGAEQGAGAVNGRIESDAPAASLSQSRRPVDFLFT